jgi:dihydrofolate synthase/folylpolyglutamate synthase
MIEDVIRWLYGLQQFGMKLGLESMRALLDRLGNPEASVPSILVGGTNGKGSVAAMLDGMLGASGIRAGLYTSPHLVRPSERVRVGGDDIDAAALGRHLMVVREACEGLVSEAVLPAHPSFFEVMTAVAWLSFLEAEVEVAVLEVGLGGRLDATNTAPAVTSVIVAIDLDHTERLGSTVEQIAGEKAGIIKEGRPVVSGVVQGEAVEVLRRACAEKGALFVDARSAARLEVAKNETFSVTTDKAIYADLAVPLAGAHQVENARVAVVAFEQLLAEMRRRPPSGAVREGLARVRWPGRLQWIGGDPPLLLDGAHNPAGGAALAEYLRRRGGRRPVLLFATMREKDVSGILAPLAPYVERVILTRAAVERAEDPLRLEPLAAALGIPVEIEPDVPRALARARLEAAGGGFVLVAGSLYLVGEVLGDLEGRPVPGPVPF